MSCSWFEWDCLCLFKVCCLWVWNLFYKVKQVSGSLLLSHFTFTVVKWLFIYCNIILVFFSFYFMKIYSNTEAFLCSWDKAYLILIYYHHYHYCYYLEQTWVHNKLKGRYRDFLYTLCHHTCIASHIIKITHYDGTFVTKDEQHWHIIITQSS